MIINKNQLKNKLKDNKNNIIIKRIYNLDKNNKIPEGTTATVEKVQSNAFTIKYDCLDREAWIYYDNIEIKDNKIYYYSYIDDFNDEKVKQAEAEAKKIGIKLIPVDPDDKINKNRYSNYKYIYKYVYIINEIIEGGC